ncbi:cob(I)yrinic acid a,c-diamide adenosyltransferase [Williamwhitmania taraxaci]|uniref:Corrinoid adenosyltransferase n=1 Tax=Williamwhitmania taraxaci TaxID=1640674 RepID=A0A1G6M531_9BACT|nr:cob(I)yrinic acid a,c-diamide adenosyltransferase [Williamwhitmania taraxaci]SDC50662.1 cob(I)alamin adenosyltransferase [Williamwhitmania taraxaci]
MKIYTKTGDKGTTSLIGGVRVPKYHPRIEAYGTVDELNSYLGLIRDQTIDEHSFNVIVEIQERRMACASILAADCENCNAKIPLISDEDVLALEQEIDVMDQQLPPLTSFILPGGHTTVSFCHIARNVCRRCERITIKLAEDTPIQENVIRYLNRLSDYLFILARYQSLKLNAKENLWKPNI